MQLTQRWLRTTSILTLSLCTAILATNQPAIAQESEKKTETDRVITIDIDFKGGTVYEYIDMIREASPDLNVVIDGSEDLVEFVQLPEIELIGVTVPTALDLLDHRTVDNENGRVTIQLHTVLGQPITIRSKSGGSEFFSGASLYVINFQGQVEEAHETQWEVWTLASIMEFAAAEDVLATIDAVLPVLGGTEEDLSIEVRFHEDTGIFAARGKPAAIDIVEKTISTLRDTAMVKRMEQDRQNRFELDRTRLQLDEARVQLEVQRMEMKEAIEQLRQKIEVRDTIIEELEKKVTKLNEELEQERKKSGQ